MERHEIEGMLVGHFVGRVSDRFEKPVAYVMSGDGLWEIRRNQLGVFRRRIAKARIPGLVENLTEGFDLTFPKPPVRLLWDAVGFFREVYTKYGTESLVRLVWDRSKDRHVLECPEQVVSRASVRFEKSALSDGKVVVAEIHSHGNMRAGFSATDDSDELADRFYGVVGKLGSFLPEIRFRLSMGGAKLDVCPSDLFDIGGDPMLGMKSQPLWMPKVSMTARNEDGNPSKH